VDQCAVQVMEHPITGASEVAMCAPITYATNPPCEGEHYADSAAYRTYDTQVPKGFLVHSLLHGAIVVWYNCPEGCAAELERVAQWADALPEDAECVPEGVPRRLIVVPDPELTVRWAASAWGWTLRAPCFDPVAFTEFYGAHYDLAPESWCLGLDVQPTTCGGSGS
jgi:hypothetical protein